MLYYGRLDDAIAQKFVGIQRIDDKHNALILGAKIEPYVLFLWTNSIDCKELERFTTNCFVYTCPAHGKSRSAAGVAWIGLIVKMFSPSTLKQFRKLCTNYKLITSITRKRYHILPMATTLTLCDFFFAIIAISIMNLLSIASAFKASGRTCCVYRSKTFKIGTCSIRLPTARKWPTEIVLYENILWALQLLAEYRIKGKLLHLRNAPFTILCNRRPFDARQNLIPMVVEFVQILWFALVKIFR